jgi:site-specific DNA recombinase
MDASPQLRGIVAKRLSHLTDVTTHLDTESKSIEEYCQRKNILVVAETEDLDVSGGKPIKERPGIGPWLTPDRLDEWDVLIFYKLDRGFRNHLDFLLFYHEFCTVHGKAIVCVAQEIDMTTRMGKRFASDLVQFAEWELEEMSQRRAAAAAVIRKAARWNGGSFSFGYEPYQDGNRWYLRPHPVHRKEVVWMAEKVVAGNSPGTVAKMLNERKIPTARDIQNAFFGRPAKGYEWTVKTIIDVLRSDLIRGYVLHYVNGSSDPPIRVVDDRGKWVRREPLIDDELWFKVQAALDASSRPRSGVRSMGSMLLQIAFCGYCGGPLYGNSARRSDGQGYNYYYLCPQCKPTASVRREILNEVVGDALLVAVGDCELTAKRILAGDDHTETLIRIGMQIADLTTQHYVHGGVDNFHAKMAELEAEHERIGNLPAEEPKVRRVGIGKTFRQWWGESDDEQRHSYLKAAGVSALIVRAEDYQQVMRFDRSTDTTDDLVLDIPTNVIREFEGRHERPSGPKPVRFAMNLSLGTLAEQLHRASSVTA